MKKPPKTRHKGYGPEFKAKAINQAMAAKSIVKTAKALHMNRGTLRQWMIEAGNRGEIKYKVTPQQQNRFYNEDFKKVAVQKTIAAKNLVQIAKELGIQTNILSDWIDKAADRGEIEFRAKDLVSTQKQIFIATAVHEILFGNNSITNLANKLQIPRTTLQQWVTKAKKDMQSLELEGIFDDEQQDRVSLTSGASDSDYSPSSVPDTEDDSRSGTLEEVNEKEVDETTEIFDNSLLSDDLIAQGLEGLAQDDELDQQQDQGADRAQGVDLTETDSLFPGSDLKDVGSDLEDEGVASTEPEAPQVAGNLISAFRAQQAQQMSNKRLRASSTDTANNPKRQRPNPAQQVVLPASLSSKFRAAQNQNAIAMQQHMATHRKNPHRNKKKP